MENHSTYDKVKALRNDPIDDGSEINFKKVPFGGFDPKEVTQYLKTLRSNMLLSEKTYNERFEEYSSASKMYLQEREVLNKKIKEQEDEINRLEICQSEIIAREKVGAQRAQKEIMELRALVSKLQDQIAGSEQTQSTAKEKEEDTRELKRLSEEIFELTETKKKLNSHNAVLINECSRIAKQNEKCMAEADDLKKTIAALKVSKRNAAMSTNMKVFEYQQNHELSIESIVGSIGDISNVLGNMKADLAGFFEKSKIDLKEENLGSLL